MVYTLLSAKKRAYFCKSIAIEMGGVSRYFSKVLGSGVGVTLLMIGETCRIKRLHSDKAGEFTAPFFAKFLSNHKTIDHTFTSGYDPQANGIAERSVGLLKALAARSLASAG